MEFVADLHLHGKYSRAVSKDMVLPVMASFARKKGLDILATSDWTHPLWFREIREYLEESASGLFKIKNQISNIKTTDQISKLNEKEILFILSTEISSIYSQGGRTRRIHNLVISPSFKTCEKINQELSKRGCNLMSDGRPIIGLSSKQLIEIVLSIDPNAMLIPCHAWTPWFSVYGSNSGFDSIEECFGEYSKYIYAVETGLSSDPEMNWRIKELENRAVISNSDAHSPAKMGREATVFIETQNSNFKDQNYSSKLKISYSDIISALKQNPKGNLKIGYTVEFYPEEGKYHYTGHRNCKVVQSPDETKEKGAVCPVCRRPVTIGVMHRVEQLAQRSQSSNLKTQKSPLRSSSFEGRAKLGETGLRWILDPTGKHPPFVKLVPLNEIVAESLSSTVASIKVKNCFDELCAKFGSEFNILLKTPVEEIGKEVLSTVTKQDILRIAEGIVKVRKGDIVLEPGFDGEYGKVKIWSFEAVQGKTSVSRETEKSGPVSSPKKEPQLIMDF